MSLLFKNCLCHSWRKAALTCCTINQTPPLLLVCITFHSQSFCKLVWCLQPLQSSIDNDGRLLIKFLFPSTPFAPWQKDEVLAEGRPAVFFLFLFFQQPRVLINYSVIVSANMVVLIRIDNFDKYIHIYFAEAIQKRKVGTKWLPSYIYNNSLFAADCITGFSNFILSFSLLCVLFMELYPIKCIFVCKKTKIKLTKTVLKSKQLIFILTQFVQT